MFIQQHPSYTVYRNTLTMLNYRKLIPVNINEDNMEEKKFISNIQYNGLITIEAKDQEDKVRKQIKLMGKSTKNRKTKTYIVIYGEKSEKWTKADLFEKSLNSIPSINDNDRKDNLDIMVITPTEVTVHVEKKINSKKFTGEIDGKPTGGYLRIDNYPYRYFNSSNYDRMAHISVGHHELLSKEDSDKLLKDMNATRNSLAKIPRNSVSVVWHGGEFGDIFAIKSDCENGYETSYRIVR
jgi:DNA-directed RNA polymerase subunit H (RpoH/RPB5)